MRYVAEMYAHAGHRGFGSTSCAEVTRDPSSPDNDKAVHGKKVNRARTYCNTHMQPWNIHQSTRCSLLPAGYTLPPGEPGAAALQFCTASRVDVTWQPDRF